MSQRTQRLNSQLQQELMQLLQREMKDPRIGFATVTSVETAPDLSSARVWVSVLGSEEDRTESLRALSAAAPWLRRQLGERLHIRTIPQLLIRRDESIESGDRVLKLLRQIEDQEGADANREDSAQAAEEPEAARETDGSD
jgi:ribosome-binding factor A